MGDRVSPAAHRRIHTGVGFSEVQQELRPPARARPRRPLSLENVPYDIAVERRSSRSSRPGEASAASGRRALAIDS